VLRAAGDTGTTQENIQDWIQLDKGDPGFHLLIFLWFSNKGSRVIFFYLFSSALPILLNFPLIFLLFLSFRAIFALLIRIIG
jgi:hypothetical protein